MGDSRLPTSLRTSGDSTATLKGERIEYQMQSRSPRWTPATLALALLMASCAPESPPPGPLSGAVVPFERKGEPPTFATICRYEFADRVEPLSIFEIGLREGVRTCFSGGKGRAFVPLRRDRCPSVLGSIGAQISRASASDEFIRCSAALRPSSASETDVVLYRPNPAYLGEDAFLTFGLDVGALVMGDMLPATHFGAGGDAVCLEGPDGDAIAQHIKAAEIALEHELSVVIERGSCQALVPRLLGREWPEIGGPDDR